ncbi:MAG: lipopolysaccharide heptosyltransferase II [Nitrospirota bacterium]|nr:lipopolysaccharide heptosyltransferase II [Nitrospirota bacterium]
MNFHFKKETIKRIVVRGPNWLGDAVMCTPALLMLRDIFPSASITLLVRPSIAALFESHPSIDHMVVYDHKGNHSGWRGMLNLVRMLRKERFDLAVLFQNAFGAALLMWLAGIPYRMGYPTDGRRLLLTESIPLPPDVTSLHQVKYYQGLVSLFEDSGKRYLPTLNVRNDEEENITEKLKACSVREDDFVIGLNPGSVYGGAERWLPERFAEAADRIVESILTHQDKGIAVHCVIVGAPGEENLGRTIASRMLNPPIVLSGKTTLQHLMAVIKRCQLFVTNDTGPMHIANAFGVPIVAIFGPTDHRTTSPFHGPFSIVRHPVDCSPCLLRECPIDHRCMTNVTVEEVLRSAEQLVSPSRSPQMRSLG